MLSDSKPTKNLMRQNLIFLTLFGLFFSCNQSNKKIAFRDSLTQRVQNDTTSSKRERQLIIEELKRVQTSNKVNPMNHGSDNIGNWLNTI
jgi:hypothetical protein